ncbi:hypothetical protein IAT40_004752 [Kwoniella sp. CBS 6097]
MSGSGVAAQPNPGPTAPEDQPFRHPNIESEGSPRSQAHSDIKGGGCGSGFQNGQPLQVFESRDAGNRKMPEAQVANNLGPAKGVVASTLPKGEKKKMEKFKYGFFSPEMKMFRQLAFKILGGTVVITIIVMWLCLPLYWGSLWKANKYTDKLTVRVIDRDGGQIGQTVSQGLLQQTNLRYFETSPSELPDEIAIEDDIVNEGVWATIVINSGASNNLVTARQNGDASYNSSSAIGVYYAQARLETATNSYLMPYIQAELGAILGQLNARSVNSYLRDNANNVTAINLLAQAPTTVSQAVWYTIHNLRPYDQPVAQAITLVGLIYMLIFAFVCTMSNNAVREIIAPFMTTGHYIAYRLIAPLCLYSVISFFFAMVNLPFKIHFGAHFTYGGGFFLWWFTLFLGMSALGLATEFMITILGPRFVSFFLFPLIISNVSVVSLPHELQPWIFRYGVAMPFYNCSRVIRTIIFDTKNDIGRNLGILIAWVVVSFITISLATWLFRRRSIIQHNKEVGENEMDSVEKVQENA